MGPVATKHAPARRASADEVRGDARRLIEAGVVHHVTYAVPCAVLMLNAERQSVYGNQCLLEMLNLPSFDAVLGQRPGELLRCVHAHEEEGGCGTTEFCRECGAVNAILRSQTSDVVAEEECRILTTTGKAYEFRVWATPYEFRGTRFTIFSLLDIGDEKRRHALEQVFFHDVGNTVTAILGFSSLLTDAPPGTVGQDELDALKHAGEQLADEIASHRSLLEAEQGSLEVVPSDIDSLFLLTELITSFEHMPQWKSRRIRIADHAMDARFFSDKTLLMRVLGNMLKNALEATSPKETVTLSCDIANDAVHFSVHNPGLIPRPTQLQIFQRSFSTKGHGRGIGTYGMKLLGEQYLGGTVSFRTSERNGTEFRISLPIDTD